MVDVDFILETVISIFLTIYYILEGMVKAVLPSQYLPKKEISKDTVLVTGAGAIFITILSRSFGASTWMHVVMVNLFKPIISSWTCCFRMVDFGYGCDHEWFDNHKGKQISRNFTECHQHNLLCESLCHIGYIFLLQIPLATELIHRLLFNLS